MAVSMRNYLKLRPFLKPHLPLLAWAILCMVLSSMLKGISLTMLVPLVEVVLLNRSVALPAWAPVPIAQAMEWFQGLGALTRLNVLAAGVAMLFLLKNIVFFFQTVLMNGVALRFLRDIRNGLYRHYQKLSQDFFSGERTGELVSRITYDVAVLQNTLTEGLSDLVYETAQVVVFSGIILAIDWRLAFLALLLLPAIGYPIVRIGKILRKLGHIVQERMADLNSRLIETLQGMRIVKAFTAEKAEMDRFAVINQDYTKANLRTVKRREALAALTDMISLLGAIAVLQIGGRAVLEEQIRVGTVILFLAALLSLYQPVKKLSRLHAINQQALSAAKRVIEILEMTPSVWDAPAARDLPRFQREIRFEELWFRYAGEERWVLQGVDFSVRAGEVVAIVGASGSGKTTLVHLLLRFYDPGRGRITLDGADLRTARVPSVRGQIGLVTQDPFLFHDSVRTNIAFGRPEASLAEVIRAAQAANAEAFIRRLPAGYDTPVGDLGFKLSGGERQRIAIARALLKDAPILVLDEATSQLDSESERLVQEALDRLMRGRTVLVIAHRFSTIRSADRIVVLDKGRIAQMGRHEELLGGSALYRRLYELQVAP